MIKKDYYLDILDKHYLSSFVFNGGSSIKFMITEPEQQIQLKDDLSKLGSKYRYLTVNVDANEIKVQQIEQIFFAIARKIDWEELTQVAAQKIINNTPYSSEHNSEISDRNLSVKTLADKFQSDPNEIIRDLNRELQKSIYHNNEMFYDFKMAMLRFVQYKLQTDQVSDSEYNAIMDWLKGDLKQISPLKTVRIFHKINRQNGRHMLYSLVYWIKYCGYSGLALTINLSQLNNKKPKGLKNSTDIYYTKTTIMDTFESIRQLVDGINEVSNFFTAVITDSRFILDQTRGVEVYQALKLRIIDEIRDANRENAFTTLVRLNQT